MNVQLADVRSIFKNAVDNGDPDGPRIFTAGSEAVQVSRAGNEAVQVSRAGSEAVQVSWVDNKEVQVSWVDNEAVQVIRADNEAVRVSRAGVWTLLPTACLVKNPFENSAICS